MTANFISEPTDTLAILGAQPAFGEPVPVGQLYFPAWDAYERAFRELFARQYYTNQGPLADKLEAQLAERMKVKHAICVTNATVGLSMVAESLDIHGTIAMPSFTFVASAQAMVWSKLRPVFCDIDPRTHQMNLEHLHRLLSDGASAVMAVNLWGDTYDMTAIEEVARRHEVPLIFDSAHGFGCSFKEKPLGGFGKAEVFSFHATKIMSTGEGGCITTDDDELAERLRNIRSSYGVRAQVNVHRTANGRMSEAQAAIGLLNLENIDTIIKRNHRLHQCYQTGLQCQSGLSVYLPTRADKSNWQYLILEVSPDEFGLSRDQLYTVLLEENVIARRYFNPGAHRCPPFSSISPARLPETDFICDRVLQLPLGAKTDEVIIERIVEIVKKAHALSPRIRSAFATSTQ
jgi:dTDP-4-amino-4,6-dideoxygalactose transaminase